MISHLILLRTRNVSHKHRTGNQNTYSAFSNFFFAAITPFVRQCGKILQSWEGHRRWYGVSALHAGYL